MAIVDTPITRLVGRTPRELALLSIGVGYCVYELVGVTCWPNLAMYAFATVLFAVRFFPARAIGMGVALGALAERLPDLRVSAAELHVPHTWAAVAVVVVLASSDLEARFDRAPSPLRWLPNAWAALPPRHMRLLRTCAYALGMLAGILAYVSSVLWFGELGAPGIAFAATSVAALSAVLILLAAGRAPALLLVPLICLPIALHLARDLPATELALAHGTSAAVADGFATSPAFALPALALALLATALALPYGAALLRRTFRG